MITFIWTVIKALPRLGKAKNYNSLPAFLLAVKENEI